MAAVTPRKGRNATAGAPARAALAKRDLWEQVLHSSWSQAARWLAVLGLVISNWASTAEPGTFAVWLPVIIISVALLLPDVHRIAFGGVELELQRTQEEVAELRGKVTVLQQVTTNVLPVDFAAAITAMGEQIREQVRERAAANVVASEGPSERADDEAPPAPEEFE